jgi:hypothetical protein
MEGKTMKRYSVFVRTWWKANKDWPNGLQPHAGRRKYVRRGLTLEEARKFCDEYARSNPPGKLGRKAEFEEE